MYGSAADAAEIAIKSVRNPGRELVFKSTNGALKKDLDLGDDWDGILEVRGLNTSTPLSAEIQYETSASIHHEGPHLDLVNWLHYQSTWMPLAAKSATQFEIKPLSERESTFFPFVSKDKFLSAVKNHAKSASDHSSSKWIELAETCKAPSEYPCSVSVSKVVLRVFEGAKDSRKLIQEIVLKVPLGC